MFFSGSSHTDASNGKFNDYGGNQVNVHNNGPVSIQISFSFNLFGLSARAPQHRHEHNDGLQLRTVDPEIRSLSRPCGRYHSPDIIIITVRLTTELLTSFGGPPNGALAQELRSLQQTLILTKLAIEGYGDGPLGQSLANTITPAVERCHVMLLALSNTVNGSWLNSIKICDMRGSIWRNWWRPDGDELASLQSQLYDIRKSLTEVLMALNSVLWVELGNKLRAGHVSLEQLHTLLRDNLPTLGNGIKIHAVRVLDHLGKIIPVPIVFCSTWKDFHYIINNFCKDRSGCHFIERGDYEVIDTEGSSQTIDRSTFASAVRSEMILEMSIVMRQATTFQDNEGKCPRCGYLNSHVAPVNGWIDCYRCLGQFQVSIDENDDKSGKNYERESGERDDENEEMLKDNKEHMDGKEDSEGRGQEIISPASQPKGRKAYNGALQSQVTDGKEFFRRIQVICMNTPFVSVCVSTQSGADGFSDSSLALQTTKSLGTKRRNFWKQAGVHGDTENIISISNLSKSDIIIVIMGPCGTGKSKFINIAAGKDVTTSGAAKINPVLISYPRDPTRRVVFVDIPGFDDIYVDDTEILRRISVWLARSYDDGMKLSGIIYLHDISQARLLGTSESRKNFEIFEKLCGDDAIKNVILATTQWKNVEADEGRAREDELATAHWKHFLDKGGEMTRFLDSHESAWTIVDLILTRNQEITLLIQRELVDLQYALPETTAAKALRGDLLKLLKIQQGFIEKLQQAGNGALDDDKRYKESQKRITKTLKQIRDLKIPLSLRIMKFLADKE